MLNGLLVVGFEFRGCNTLKLCELCFDGHEELV